MTMKSVSTAALQSVSPLSPFNLRLFILRYQLVRLSTNFTSRGTTVYNLYATQHKKKIFFWLFLHFLYPGKCSSLSIIYVFWDTNTSQSLHRHLQSVVLMTLKIQDVEAQTCHLLSDEFDK